MERKDFDNKSVLEALPTELLVYIFHLIPTTRGKATLRYVSQRIRNVTEVPSLWKEFVWSYYEDREEYCVCNLLKSCGSFIKTLSFPNHVPPTLHHLLRYCNDVVELILPTTKLDRVQVGKVMGQMQHLQKLDVQWSLGLIRLLVIKNELREVTIRCPAGEVIENFRAFRISLNLFLFMWASKGCLPQYLSIVGLDSGEARLLSIAWQSWNKTLSAGCTGCIRVYDRLNIPLGLFLASPLFQFHFGQASPLSCADVKKFGLMGLCNPNLSVTDHMYISSIYDCDIISVDHKDSNTSILTFVTEFDLSYRDTHSVHLEQLAILCPNLIRLNLFHCKDCLRSLKGLRAIASCCHNLQGVNLLGIQVTMVENHMQLWEILSGLKLTHLAIDLCNLMPFEDNDVNKQNLLKLYQKFVHLKALHLEPSEIDSDMLAYSDSDGFDDHPTLLLSYFPSLTYCRLYRKSLHASTVIRDIVNNCQELKCLHFTAPILTAPDVNLSMYNLQQLYIESVSFVVTEAFMNAISLHGRLEHVILLVNSMSYEGMAALIANSPLLLTFRVIVHNFVTEVLTEVDLKKMFSNRRLFNCGGFSAQQFLPTTKFEAVAVITDVTSDVTSSLWVYHDLSGHIRYAGDRSYYKYTM